MSGVRDARGWGRDGKIWGAAPSGRAEKGRARNSRYYGARNAEIRLTT